MSNVSVNLGITAANGKKSTKAITDIEPNANNSDINAFVDAAMNLTTNMLTSITKVTKEDIDKNYTPITITVDSNKNVTPTINGSTISFSASDCWNVSEQYTGDGDTARFIYVDLIFKAGTIQVNTENISTIVPTMSMIYPTVYKADDTNNNVQLAFWIAGVNSASEIQGQGFSFIIPTGTSGSVSWDTATYTVEVV